MGVRKNYHLMGNLGSLVCGLPCWLTRFALLLVLAMVPGVAKASWVMVGPSCSKSVNGIGFPVYGFNGSEYFDAATVIQGSGYWVESPNHTVLLAQCSSAPTSPVPVSLKEGFNLVGNPFTAPLNLAQFLDPAHEVVFVYRNGQYISLGVNDSLLPNEGAWWYSDKNTSKNLMASQGSGTLDTLRIIAVCQTTPNPTDAQRLVPGGAGCRVSPSAAPGECPYTAPFELWEGGELYTMAVLTSAAGGPCSGETPSPQDRAGIDLAIDPSTLLSVEAKLPPQGLIPWASSTATFALTSNLIPGESFISASSATKTTANQLKVTSLDTLTVVEAVFCPLEGADPETVLQIQTLAQNCIEAAKLSPLEMELNRTNSGSLEGRIALAVKLSNGTYGIVPAGQVDLNQDVHPNSSLQLSVDSAIGFKFKASSPLDIRTSLSSVVGYTLRIKEPEYDKIVVCPITLLLDDPDLQYGPVDGDLPPLPPLVYLNGSYSTGPMPSPVFSQEFMIPQTSLTLCANSSQPLTTQARWGQPIAFFIAGRTSGGTGVLINLGIDPAHYLLPGYMAISELPGTAGAVNIMPLSSGVIQPNSLVLNAPILFPLTLDLKTDEPAEMTFACSSQGQPLTACAVENNVPTVTRSATIKIAARYLNDANNDWPDLPPLVGHLQANPSDEISISTGDPASEYGWWWDSTVYAIDLLGTSQVYELTQKLADQTLVGELHIKPGTGGSNGDTLVVCAAGFNEGDAVDQDAAVTQVLANNCPHVNSIILGSGKNLVVSVSTVNNGVRTQQSIPIPPNFQPSNNLLSSTIVGGFAYVYDLSGGGTITVGIGPPGQGSTASLTVIK